MSEKLSTRLSKVFHELPPEAQQTLLEKSLADVLDTLPPNLAKKVYSSALKVQTKHQNVPKLDLRAKRKEVNALLDLLTRESKMSMFGDRARREEILSEIIHSVTGWLNDVWSAFYEHHVQFSAAHSCLLFVSEVLAQLDALPTPGGCKCEVMNMPVRVTIKDKHGACMTKLRVRGPYNADRLLLWIWRDLLLSILARGLEEDERSVQNILSDLEQIYGFPVFYRLLTGGKKVGPDDEEDDEDEGTLPDESYSDADDGEDDVFFLFRTVSFRASHWKGKFDAEMTTLRGMVTELMFSIFTIAPSVQLYDAIQDVSTNPPGSALRASAILQEVAGNTSDTLAGALSIEVSKNNANRIVALLVEHGHLLRPRDAVPLQCAAAVLGDSPLHAARGLSLLSDGLTDTLHAIQSAVRKSFARIDDPAHKKELLEIIKLRSGTVARRDRVEAWVQKVVSTPAGGMGPMALAAMMFGIPMMPGMPPIPGLGGAGDDGGMGGEDPGDLLSFIDFEGAGGDESNSVDMEDLREEFRPKLKQWLDGWTQLAGVMKGGPGVAAKAYVKAIETMPFLRASDVVNEMVQRLSERPGKAFICDALESLSSFCKSQRKKINLAKKEKEKQAAAKDKLSVAASTSNPSSSSTSPSAPTPGPSTAPTPTPDVEAASRSSTPPPPLIPANPTNRSGSSTPPPPLIPATSTSSSSAQQQPSTPSVNMGFFSIPLPFAFGSSSSANSSSSSSGSGSASSATGGRTAAPAPAPAPGPSRASTSAGAPAPGRTENRDDGAFRVFQGMEDVD